MRRTRQATKRAAAAGAGTSSSTAATAKRNKTATTSAKATEKSVSVPTAQQVDANDAPESSSSVREPSALASGSYSTSWLANHVRQFQDLCDERLLKFSASVESQLGWLQDYVGGVKVETSKRNFNNILKTPGRGVKVKKRPIRSRTSPSKAAPLFDLSKNSVPVVEIPHKPKRISQDTLPTNEYTVSAPEDTLPEATSSSSELVNDKKKRKLDRFEEEEGETESSKENSPFVVKSVKEGQLKSSRGAGKGRKAAGTDAAETATKKRKKVDQSESEAAEGTTDVVLEQSTTVEDVAPAENSSNEKASGKKGAKKTVGRKKAVKEAQSSKTSTAAPPATTKRRLRTRKNDANDETVLSEELVGVAVDEIPSNDVTEGTAAEEKVPDSKMDMELTSRVIANASETVVAMSVDDKEHAAPMDEEVNTNNDFAEEVPSAGMGVDRTSTTNGQKASEEDAPQAPKAAVAQDQIAPPPQASSSQPQIDTFKPRASSLLSKPRELRVPKLSSLLSAPIELPDAKGDLPVMKKATHRKHLEAVEKKSVSMSSMAGDGSSSSSSSNRGDEQKSSVTTAAGDIAAVRKRSPESDDEDSDGYKKIRVAAVQGKEGDGSITDGAGSKSMEEEERPRKEGALNTITESVGEETIPAPTTAARMSPDEPTIVMSAESVTVVPTASETKSSITTTTTTVPPQPSDDEPFDPISRVDTDKIRREANLKTFVSGRMENLMREVTSHNSKRAVSSSSSLGASVTGVGSQPTEERVSVVTQHAQGSGGIDGVEVANGAKEVSDDEERKSEENSRSTNKSDEAEQMDITPTTEDGEHEKKEEDDDEPMAMGEAVAVPVEPDHGSDDEEEEEDTDEFVMALQDMGDGPEAKSTANGGASGSPSSSSSPSSRSGRSQRQRQPSKEEKVQQVVVPETPLVISKNNGGGPKMDGVDDACRGDVEEEDDLSDQGGSGRDSGGSLDSNGSSGSSNGGFAVEKKGEKEGGGAKGSKLPAASSVAKSGAKAKVEIKSLQAAALLAKKQQAEKDRRAAQSVNKPTDQRVQQVQQRKQEEEQKRLEALRKNQEEKSKKMGLSLLQQKREQRQQEDEAKRKKQVQQQKQGASSQQQQQQPEETADSFAAVPSIKKFAVSLVKAAGSVVGAVGAAAAAASGASSAPTGLPVKSKKPQASEASTSSSSSSSSSVLATGLPKPQEAKSKQPMQQQQAPSSQEDQPTQSTSSNSTPTQQQAPRNLANISKSEIKNPVLNALFAPSSPFESPLGKGKGKAPAASSHHGTSNSKKQMLVSDDSEDESEDESEEEEEEVKAGPPAASSSGKRNVVAGKTLPRPVKGGKTVPAPPKEDPNLPTTIVNENGDLPDIPTDEEYDEEDHSDEESDDHDESPRGKGKSKPNVPTWAETPNLMRTLEAQTVQDPDEIFGTVQTCHLEEIFKGSRKNKFRARTSSANWTGMDRLTEEEEREYKQKMGFNKSGKGN
ncbi:hypothetical protein HK102_009467 [Quaeritorhiza haematococci]|nr:hypothetical protein HK102_009467 [Quaeritorhiza haematococci]